MTEKLRMFPLQSHQMAHYAYECKNMLERVRHELGHGPYIDQLATFARKYQRMHRLDMGSCRIHLQFVRVLRHFSFQTYLPQ